MPHAQDVVDRIIELAKAGVTRKDIGAKFGLSRSALCGILWRRGIAPAARPAKGAKKPAHKLARLKTAKPSNPVPVKFTNLVNLESPGVSWGDLQLSHCRWPLDGDRWCGQTKREGSYCFLHFALAYRASHQRAAA